MVTFLGVLAFMGYLIGIFLAFIKALDAFQDDERTRGWSWVLLVMALIALPVALALDSEDPHAHQLCRAGHEAWVTESHLVGKVMTETTSKQWFCDRWEEAR